MSDGPHKSLPMKRAWKRVAECADNQAFSPEEIGAAMVPALEQDCHDELAPAFLHEIRDALEARESGLFKSDPMWINGLRSVASNGLERAILDNIDHGPSADAKALDVLRVAVEGVLRDRAARCERQIEEHYLRRRDAPRVAELRARIDRAIELTPMDTIAARVIDPGHSMSPRLNAKKSGLDDGVMLP